VQETPSSVLDAEVADEPTPAPVAAGPAGSGGQAAPPVEPAEPPSEGGDGGEEAAGAADAAEEELGGDDEGESNATGAAAAGGGDMASQVRQLGAQVALQAEQLQAAERAKQDLEDMLIRIEKHFKTEQGLRRKAEASLAESRAQARGVEDMKATVAASQLELKKQRHALDSSRDELNDEKVEMEGLLEQARLDAKKAQASLQHAEEDAAAAEDMIRLKLEAEYKSKISRLVTELERVRGELESRTDLMRHEMQRWKHQAEQAAASLRDAKNEVLERKGELDRTNEKMIKMVEKLYVGREKGLELKSNIDFQMQNMKAQQAQDAQQAQRSLATPREAGLGPRGGGNGPSPGGRGAGDQSERRRAGGKAGGRPGGGEATPRFAKAKPPALRLPEVKSSVERERGRPGGLQSERERGGRSDRGGGGAAGGRSDRGGAPTGGARSDRGGEKGARGGDRAGGASGLSPTPARGGGNGLTPARQAAPDMGGGGGYARMYKEERSQNQRKPAAGGKRASAAAGAPRRAAPAAARGAPANAGRGGAQRGRRDSHAHMVQYSAGRLD